MKALANEEVGNYLNQHFVSSFQKIANFRIVGGQKVGGNVASYFTLEDGSVLHILAGPVDAATLLREARWVVETRKLAITASQGSSARYKTLWRRAHAERLLAEHGMAMNRGRMTGISPQRSTLSSAHEFVGRGLHAQAQVHLLLTRYPLTKIDKVYHVVFEKILGQTISTIPVDEGDKSETAFTIFNAPLRDQQPETTMDTRAEAQQVEENALTPAEKVLKEEQDAARRLNLAKLLAVDAENGTNLINHNRDREGALRNAERLRRLAGNRFREIVDKYPNTKAAQAALGLLGEE